MSLEPLTFPQIVQQQVDQFKVYQELFGLPVTDLLEGSQTRGLFEGTAAPMEELMVRIAVDLPSRFYFGDAEDEALDRLIESWSFGRVERIDAAKSAGNLDVEGEDGAFVPVGQKFRTDSGWLVSTLVAVSINPGEAFVSAPAVSVLEGAAGNLPVGTVLTPEPAIAGVTRAVVTEAWTGGTDRQSDEEYQASFLEWLDSLSRGTRPALVVGAGMAGYTRAYVVENYGRIVVYLDDGGPASETKLTAAQSLLRRAWKCAGPPLRTRGYLPKLYTLPAEAFSSATQTKAQLQAAIEAKWVALFSTKKMGDPVTRLELLAAAATVPGYNGVNLDLEDQLVAEQLDDYGMRFGPGGLLPYQRPVLAGVAWS